MFAIGLHVKDIALLEKIQFSMGVGKIHKHGQDSIQYRVESIKDLQVIIDHLDKYPLMSAKVADYALFKKAFLAIKAGEHLNKDGLLAIVGIKAHLNLGLNPSLIKAFPNIVEVNKPEYIFKGPLQPSWLAGFVSGDGSFNIKTSSSTTSKLGKRIQLRFGVGLNIREKDLIIGIADFFSLEQGKHVHSTDSSVYLEVSKFTDIIQKIIPFFEEYPIQGIKGLDFSDFKEAASIMENNEHLTTDGYDSIIRIRNGMNRSR